MVTPLLKYNLTALVEEESIPFPPTYIVTSPSPYYQQNDATCLDRPQHNVPYPLWSFSLFQIDVTIFFSHGNHLRIKVLTWEKLHFEECLDLCMMFSMETANFKINHGLQYYAFYWFVIFLRRKTLFELALSIPERNQEWSSRNTMCMFTNISLFLDNFSNLPRWEEHPVGQQKRNVGPHPADQRLPVCSVWNFDWQEGLQIQFLPCPHSRWMLE